MKTIRTNTNNPYSIYIEAGLRSRVPEMLSQFPNRKLAVVTDDTVDLLYADKIAASLAAEGRQVCKMAFPHGEGSKNLDTVQNVYRFLSENAITRSDMIVAVGGGVVGDLAGFAAATWLRGIPFVQVPTTLLAMVDSSVGGKTGVDLPQGKNLVGAFWQPAMVICDPETLNTLPQETFSDGMAEAIKTGAILDAGLFSLIEQGGLREQAELMEEVVARCVDHKRAVVEQDERDKGVRQWLNFGHTLGHAIEKESGYAIPHGRAVSMGMVLMAEICQGHGITPAGTAHRIAACCARYGLPTATEYSLETLSRHCMGDKKRAGSALNLVVLERLGKAALYPVEAENLLTFLKGGSPITAAVRPGPLQGSVTAPPSKSAAHRGLICAALAGEGRVAPVSHSADMTATLEALHGLGFSSRREGDAVVFGPPISQAQSLCPCGESGSTLRFLLPVAAALGRTAVFTGEGRLPERPLEPLISLMKAHGVAFSSEALPFTISGKLTPGRYDLPGDVSSQFISGLLFALPLLEGDSQIMMTSPMQSAGYVNLTIQSLAASGITVKPIPGGYIVPGGQTYRPRTGAVEGDWSGAAFWLCAGALWGQITVTGLDAASIQGDRAVLDILREMGAAVDAGPSAVTVSPAPLHGVSIDAGPIPDLIPILAVTAAFAAGDTEIYNAARLRFKESDRLATTAALLRALGGRVEEFNTRLLIHGGIPLRGGMVNGANDHRVVMSAAIAALGCNGPVRISDAQAVRKSYPDFFTALKALGGDCDVF